MVVFAVDISRRVMKLRGTSLRCERRTLLSQQCTASTEWLGSRPGRDALGVQVLERYPDLCGGSGIRIEQLAGPKHGMHYYRQFARHRHGSSFEADPLAELQTPRGQSAVG